MQTKKPMIKETVGSLYYAFNQPTEGVDFDPSTWQETVNSPVIKNISRTENGESTPVMASGIDYTTVSQSSNEEIDVEVIAFHPEDLATLRGEGVDESGLIFSGRTSTRPYIALGFPVQKIGGGVRYVWYPKCQLVENSDEIATKEESFTEQNDTLKFRAYAFNSFNDKKVYVDSEAANFPEGLTEEKFFTKPILTKEDLAAAIATTENTEVQGA